MNVQPKEYALGWLLALLAVAGLTGAALAQDAREFAYLPVHSAPAADLVEVLRPMVGEGSLTAHRDQLIVRGTAAEIAAVEQALDRLDRPARRLMIEVRHASQSAGGAMGGREIRTLGRDQFVQRVQTLDGSAALIRIGETRPVLGAVGGWSGRRPGERGGIIGPVDYQSVETGFYALARVHGDQVTVEVYQQDERALPQGGVRSASAQTLLRGQLGEWLDVGGEQRAQQAGVRTWATQNQAERRLQIRVQEMD